MREEELRFELSEAAEDRLRAQVRRNRRPARAEGRGGKARDDRLDAMTSDRGDSPPSPKAPRGESRGYGSDALAKLLARDLAALAGLVPGDDGGSVLHRGRQLGQDVLRPREPQ